MKKYLIDTHCHTSETSTCGKTPGAEVVKLYRSLGYSGVMITDHLNKFTFESLRERRPNPSWQEHIDCFLKGYNEALKESKKYDDFKVYLGCELRFVENDNDYLVFGLTQEKLRKMDGVIEMRQEYGLEYVRSLGCVIIQAHPFRFDATIIEPGYYNGVEVYNGHKNHQSHNDIALIWAKKYNYIMTSGTDFHGEHDPTSGIYVDKLPENSEQLRDIILSGDYDLKTNGELDI